MNLGLLLGYSGKDLSIDIGAIKRAESMGFDSVWTSEAYGSDSACAVVYRASQPEQRIVWTTAGQLADAVRTAGITRTALVVAGRVLDVSLEALVHHSKLYDRHFAHGYRDSEK